MPTIDGQLTVWDVAEEWSVLTGIKVVGCQEMPEVLRVAGDLQQQTPLMMVVVDPHPALGGVGGTENATLSIHHPDEIQGRVSSAGRGFAEAESVNLVDVA